MKVADMHCDTISALNDSGLRSNHLHIDLNKMKKGDYLVQNFALFINLKGDRDPLEHCLRLVDLYYQELERNKDLISPALDANDIIANEKQGKISGVLTIEEGGVAKGSLENLRKFYRLGVRMLTLTWNYENELGYPANNIDKSSRLIPSRRGLKECGINFIREMEDLGMIIDVSHLSDEGVEDVLTHTKTPFVASHSNARAICNHPRNLPDNLIKEMAERGCVIGINFYPEFLEDNDLVNKDDALNRVNKGTITGVVDHINHIINIAGEDCIGLGSDFDGMSGHDKLKDASYLPKLAQVLEDRGIAQNVIEKIFYKNVLNLYKEVL